jgi:hypothetical protein
MAAIIITPNPYSYASVSPGGTALATFSIAAPNGAVVIDTIVLADMTNFSLMLGTLPIPFRAIPGNPNVVYDMSNNPFPASFQVQFNPATTAMFNTTVKFSPASMSPNSPTSLALSGAVSGNSNPSTSVLLPIESNGGISQLAYASLIPMQDVNTGETNFYAFDPLFGFDDPVAPSVHSFRVEDLIAGRNPTFNRILLTYRDLGLWQATLTLSGTNDAQKIVSKTINISGGNAVATNRLFTKFYGIEFTAENVQCTISRLPKGGPLSIIKTVLCGRMEATKYG